MNLQSYPDGTPFESADIDFQWDIPPVQKVGGGINPGMLANQIYQKEFDALTKIKGKLSPEQKQRMNWLNMKLQIPKLDQENFSNIIYWVAEDTRALGRDFIRIGSKDNKIPDGYYRACVAWSASYESGLSTSGYKMNNFHFFRQNTDGTWSSKSGVMPVRNEGKEPSRNFLIYEHYEYFAVSIK